MTMRCLLAIDSFKGCLSSAEVEATVAQTLTEAGVDVVSVPLSDGGEGMLETFAAALHAQMVEAPVRDLMMRHITASYAITDDGTAIIDTSKVCGLTLQSPETRNPMVATTYGVGELVAHAYRKGCRRFIIGLGGSGTSDAGIGMLKALVDKLAKGKTIDNVWADYLHNCQFTLACDVRNPLCGPDGAAYTFARQKGATEAMLPLLDARARRFAEMSAKHLGFDKSTVPGAGAAGGLGYAFLQYLNARSVSGADLLLDLSHFDCLLANAGLVVTGEGHADHQTLMGKLPERVLKRAQQISIPVWLMAGAVEDRTLLTDAGFRVSTAVTPLTQPLTEAMKPDVARANIRRWVTDNLIKHLHPTAE